MEPAIAADQSQIGAASAVNIAGLAEGLPIGGRHVVGRLPHVGEFVKAEPAQCIGVRGQRQDPARCAEVGAIMHP